MSMMVSTSTYAQAESESDVIITSSNIWSNWFVSGGVGASMFAGEADLAPAIDVAVGKWFSPYVGARLMYSGPQLKGFTYSSSNQFVDGSTDGGYNQKWSYMYLHADAMLNVSNLIGGYREDRFYSVIPYAGFGWACNTTSSNDALAGSLGIYNSFRLGSKVDLFLDVRGTIFGEDGFDAEVGGDHAVDGMVTATVGIAYRFGKQGWKKPVAQSVLDGYEATISANEAAIEAANAKLAAEEKKNADLAKQLAAAKAEAANAKTEVDIPSTVILFDINSSKLSNIAKVNLTEVADAIKKTDSSNKYSLVGYADNKTGTAAYNDKLSQARAESVYEFLTQECGVSSSKLSVSSKGGVDNMYYDEAALSRVVIVE